MSIGFHAHVTGSSFPNSLQGRLDLHLRMAGRKDLPYGIAHAQSRLFCLVMQMTDYELTVFWKGTIQI